MNDPVVPVVTLHHALPRGARRTNLPPLDFTLGVGLHAVLGTPQDGTLAIAGLVSGVDPSASGDVIVLGRDPGRDPALRASIGATLDAPRLPTASLVGTLLTRIDTLRESPSSTEMLALFGLAHWSPRKLGSLSPRERRALELIVAVSTPRPVALVLTEPGADIAPLDRQVLRESLVAARAAGACVIVVTASMSDAIELAENVHLLERGRITHWVPSDQTGALLPGRGIELRVEVDYPRLLVASLADDPNVLGISWDQERHRSVLSFRGESLDRLALAVARAATTSGANVRSIAPIAPGLDEVRAAASGLALAAHHAAYHAWYAQDSAARATPEGLS